jgi:hypothetical protein
MNILDDKITDIDPDERIERSMMLKDEYGRNHNDPETMKFMESYACGEIDSHSTSRGSTNLGP